MNDHWRLTQALTALHSARRTLLETDPDLRLDEVELSAALGSEQATVEDAIRSTIAAAIIADCNAAQADERAKRLIERRDRYRRRSESLRSAVFAAMDALGVGRMEWPEVTVSIALPRPGAVITDPDALPDDFVKIERTPRKDAIRNALMAGQEVPGAQLLNGMPTLHVRTK